MEAKLFIDNGKTRYFPSVLDGVTWTTERRGSPGVLKFSVYSDDSLNFEEGNSVGFIYDEVNIFYGFIFTKKRSKNCIIEVTAYDQLRYLKNKDTYAYVNKKASEVIKMISADFNLNTGDIEDTGYVIPSRVEDNQTLFDVINNALDLTLRQKGLLYTFFDDYGKITLKNIKNMAINLLICEESGEDYDYTSSIDTNTYNKIKLTYDNKSSGNREVFIAHDVNNIKKWGTLQYSESINSDSNKNVDEIRALGKEKKEALLKLFNQKTRALSFKNLFGDTRARAGVRIWVNINLGDIYLNNYMLINKATHSFRGIHKMDLELIGGGIYSG